MKKTLVITGASGGIGSVIAESFASKGWHVIAIDIAKPATDDSTVDYKQCDLAAIDQVRTVSQEICAKYAQIDALVNCAAFQGKGQIHEIDERLWDQTMAVNVRAPWLLMKYLLPSLREANGGASIVNIGSIHSMVTSHGMTAYAVSKSALSGLTRSASIEYANYGLRVNTIIPGAVDTQMLRDHLSEDQIHKLISRQLVPELIHPDAIADLVHFLVSPGAKYITGQDYVIDSGVTPQLVTEV